MNRPRKPTQASRASQHRRRHRTMRVEPLESRRLLAADPIHVGVVYLETDYLESDVGSDSQGDRFLVSFTGGAPGTRLKELTIRTDKDGDGISVGDPLYDTAAGSRGKNGFHDFTLTPGQSEQATASVEDGGQELRLQFADFAAGDQLEFTIDVDEVLRNVADLELFNQRLDVITSGQEFQDSILEAVFDAPNYHLATATDIFLNDYGDPGAAFGLDLPPDESDDVDSLPNRSAAAIGSVTQQPQVASIGGFVYRDDNDSATKDPGELGLSGVSVQLQPIDTIEPQAVLTIQTEPDGSYQFNGLMPGRYRIVELTQPSGLADGRDAAGTIAGRVVGTAVNPGDELRDIVLGGGDRGINYNFGELPLGSIQGSVYLANPGEDCDGIHDVTRSTPLIGVKIDLIGELGQVVASTTTNDQGLYRFDQVVAGVYEIIQHTPSDLLDGESHTGEIRTLSSEVLVGIGTSVNGSHIEDLTLVPGGNAVEYDFCEAAPASISGQVYHDRNDNGQRDFGEEAIPNVELNLIDSDGRRVATARTETDGSYRFDRLAADTYQVFETQPNGFIDGKDSVGQIDGQTIGRLGNNSDSLVDIVLRQGLHGTDYDFGERQLASLSGRVHVDVDEDCEYDEGEQTLGGVEIKLVDSQGQVIATTLTGVDGRYRFDNIQPGTYTVIEEQPVGFFEGGADVGSVGGVAVGGSRIDQVTLTSGENAVDYDFCERPPAEINGFVYHDRDSDCFRDEGEEGLAGVVVELLNDRGNVIETTTTDSLGRYRFSNLEAGQYAVGEIQPAGFFHGGQVAGSHGGNDSQADLISLVDVGWGETLTDYNFCELTPSEISGVVYVDHDADCVQDFDDPGLGGVTVQLFNGSNQLVSTTTTSADGSYRFANLPSGEYSIREIQPSGYFHGGQTAGSGGGNDSSPDLISQITLGWGQSLTRYDFCELEPVSVAGKVWSDVNADTVFDSQETPLSGVLIELSNEAGEVVETTRTDADGCYKFENLRPGTYVVAETQPDGYFQGPAVVGDHGGRVLRQDVLGDIVLQGGDDAREYNFPELPPAKISGYVFQDGSALVASEAPDPSTLRDFRDGELTPDDTRLGGVEVQLRNVQGLPVSPLSNALPGFYADDQITTQTDANGYYEFAGLRPLATYSVFQVQPNGLIDSLDTPGTAGGTSLNPADLSVSELDFLVQQLAPSVDPKFDAILRILVQPGQTSVSNNFSEIEIEDPPVFPPGEEDPEELVQLVAPPIETFISYEPIVGTGEFANPTPPMVADDEWAVSWHLSVINGGFPRGDGSEVEFGRMTMADGRLQINALSTSTTDPRHVGQLPDALMKIDLSMGQWDLGKLSGKSIRLGHEDATALTGDFDGDGVDEAVLFLAGQWFIDLNGNGLWDAGDLWVRLGTELDRPVVGDWDGDGKDDVGIFGRRWHNDDRRIRQDPGLPDPANQRRRELQRSDMVHREPTEQEKRQRVLARGEDGEFLADAVDHVFQYGEQVDTPMAGDWNGDGIDQIGVFRGGQWLLDEDGDGRWTSRDQPNTFGRPGDEPIVGDFDGDGIDEIGVVRGDLWIIDSDGDRKITGNDKQIRKPRSDGDSQPIVGDFDGDDRDDLGYYRGAS